jgi:hypothetical protein
MVRLIRSFQPHVIILRFSGTPRDGHGHHQASAILGKEAFAAAADAGRFPNSGAPWKPVRLLWNAFSFTRDQDREAAAMPGRMEVDLGEYDPLLGYSYSEIAGMSRSMHWSQGMGSPERRGPMKNYFVHVAGDMAMSDIFEGVPKSIRAPIRFDPRNPESAVKALLDLREKETGRRVEIDEAIALCTGLWLDANSERPTALEGSAVRVAVQAINRSRLPVEFLATEPGGPVGKPLAYNAPVTTTLSLPAQSAMSVLFRLRVLDREIALSRDVHHRYVHKVRGELTRPIAVVPPVSVEFLENPVVFPKPQSRIVSVRVRSHAPDQSGSIALESNGATVEPPTQPYRLGADGEEQILHFSVTPRKSAPIAANGNRTVTVIDYPHIPAQTVVTKAESTIVRTDIRTLARRVGYVMGAGDEIPEALRQIGCEVTLLTAEQIASSDLSALDAIVIGVRAYNTRPELRSSAQRLLDYVVNGGTMVVQYNVAERGGAFELPAPYRLKIGTARVSVEEAPVEVLKQAHPLLTSPNRITAEDFSGWIQERGLYFASEWDSKYETVLATHDPGEPPLPGGLLYARHGKGVYIFTAYSWFRQLPAGVPGAYRIFANLISAGKAQ